MLGQFEVAANVGLLILLCSIHLTDLSSLRCGHTQCKVCYLQEVCKICKGNYQGQPSCCGQRRRCFYCQEPAVIAVAWVCEWIRLYDLVKGNNVTEAQLEKETERDGLIVKEMRQAWREEAKMIMEEKEHHIKETEETRVTQAEMREAQPEIDREAKERTLVEAELMALYSFMNGLS
jgi:hypothetical protein